MRGHNICFNAELTKLSLIISYLELWMQMEQQSVDPDLGLHCYLRPICPIIYQFYGIF